MYNKLKNIIPHKIKIDNFSARLLSKDDLPMVQKFFENNGDFFIMVGGDAPTPNEAEETLNLLPNSKTAEDKFWIGLFDSDNLAAFVDIVQNYKTENQWTIGDYIVDKNYRRQGLATKLLSNLENMLLSLRVESLRIVVQEQNVCGMAFWQKMNFKEEYRRKQDVFTDKDELIMVKKLEKREPTIEEKYFKNGKLVNFPSKPNEQQEVYKIMATWFEKGKKYTEPQVNELIKSRIECRDHATLRRDLVDNHYLNRSDDGEEYWG